MANLRSLLYTDAATFQYANLREFVVGHTTNTPSNGGCCCQWTVPAGTNYIKFEKWYIYLSFLSKLNLGVFVAFGLTRPKNEKDN